MLETTAAFRMPASYDTLAALFVGDGKLFPAELGLDGTLTELEDRGLLGWDRRANRYDLHPIVRGVAWNGLDAAARQGVYAGLHDHFEPLPKIADWRTGGEPGGPDPRHRALQHADRLREVR